MNSSSTKLLLLDDSETLLRHVETILSAEGFQVKACLTTAHALIAVKDDPTITAVLADFLLANGETGIQAIQSIRTVSKNVTKAALISHAKLTPIDQKKIIELKIALVSKPIRNRESDFIQSVALWLKS